MIVKDTNQQLWDICRSDNLCTYDPYDVWKTNIGLALKRNFYKGGLLVKGLSGILYFSDLYLNNRLRLGYKKQEYAIVRALACQILDNQFLQTGDESYLKSADAHLDWLLRNAKKSAHGVGWGLDFPHAVSSNVIYSDTTPFSTITPYILEAIILHESTVDQKLRYQDTCKLIFEFFDKDIQVLERTDDFEVTSYGPLKDRRVANAVSYTMYSLVLLDRYFDYSLNTGIRVERLYNYLKSQQLQDGSWYYSDEGNSFIDCFHSCIILKNLIKSRATGIALDSVDHVIERGYKFLKTRFWDDQQGLYKRFTKTNKPGFISFDLYDNAEMLQCAVLMDDLGEAQKIAAAIKDKFIYSGKIYSGIDILGRRRNPDMLRWAIMPYLFSLNLFESHGRKNQSTFS